MTKEDKKEYQKKYRRENSEALKRMKKLYREENSQRIKDYQKKYYEENTEYFRAYNKTYNTKNLESKKSYNKKYASIKRKTDPVYKMQKNVRCRVNKFFKSSNIKKDNTTFDMVGCTPEFLMDHLETLFKEGMTRENHGFRGWHIDHIVPLISAGADIEKAKELCHYTNLQPLWWWENIEKADKCC